MGNLTDVDYPASPDVHFGYDALNRVTNMVDGVGTTVYTYTSGNQLLTEDGPFASDTVTNTYQNRLRVVLGLQQPTGVWTNGFIYDAARRLTNVTSQAGSFGYDFAMSGKMVKKLLLPNTAYITNTFDGMARLTGTRLNNSANATLDAMTYGYNLLGQRTASTNAAGAYYQYAYDNIGQLKVADNSVNTEDRGYFYDAAWNLNRRTNNGAVGTFTVDNKNQLTADPTYNYNSFDLNGNLTEKAYAPGYAVEDYTYDGENRLTSITHNPSGPPPSTWWKTEFGYDGLGRLRKRTEYSDYQSGVWVNTSITLYLYDGNRVIQERNGANTPLVSYTRGLDLSGSLEGAGGIGGLLGRSHGYSAGNWTVHNFYHADGNGNVTALAGSSQTLSASYRYDPFGNTLSSSGSLANANVYRFSSKEIHTQSGFYYYLYRFYDPSLQRWINRDPLWTYPQIIRTVSRIASSGFRAHLETANVLGSVNLYKFVGNNPLLQLDPFGLMTPEEQHDAFCAGLCAEKAFWESQMSNPILGIEAPLMLVGVNAALISEGCPPCEPPPPPQQPPVLPPPPPEPELEPVAKRPLRPLTPIYQCH